MKRLDPSNPIRGPLRSLGVNCFNACGFDFGEQGFTYTRANIRAIDRILAPIRRAINRILAPIRKASHGLL